MKITASENYSPLALNEVLALTENKIDHRPQSNSPDDWHTRKINNSEIYYEHIIANI